MYRQQCTGGGGSVIYADDFLTSVIIGLCLGSSAFIAMAYGKKNTEKIKNGIFLSFAFTALITVLLIVLFCAGLDTIIKWLRVPQETVSDMRIYLFYVFMGFFATFIYNYISNLLRGLENSVVPLFFLALSVVLNIALDILFVAGFQMGIAGAAQATVLAQYISGFGLLIYYWIKYPRLRLHKKDCVEQGRFYVNPVAVGIYMLTAVGHEFRHFNGAGIGQQLWCSRYGGICRCGQD